MGLPGLRSLLSGVAVLQCLLFRVLEPWFRMLCGCFWLSGCRVDLVPLAPYRPEKEASLLHCVLILVLGTRFRVTLDTQEAANSNLSSPFSAPSAVSGAHRAPCARLLAETAPRSLGVVCKGLALLLPFLAHRTPAVSRGRARLSPAEVGRVCLE